MHQGREHARERGAGDAVTPIPCARVGRSPHERARSRAGAPCPPFENPADHILDTINSTSTSSSNGAGGNPADKAPAILPGRSTESDEVAAVLAKGDDAAAAAAATDRRSATVEVRARAGRPPRLPEIAAQ